MTDTTYTQDGRLALPDLYAAYTTLATDFGWQRTTIYTQADWPITVFFTTKRGPALWVLAGIHGEEPAGPNAIATHISYIAALGNQFPLVLFPLCNPLGYSRNWRYPNESRDWKKGHSVSDSEHLLLNAACNGPRQSKPTSPEAEALTQAVLKLLPVYPPRLAIDHHEDEALAEAYVYSHGALGVDDPVAVAVIDHMKQAGMPIQTAGVTRFGETVHRGVVSSSHDGSIDELLTAEKVYVDGEVIQKPYAPSAIVVETPVIQVPLPQRVATHAAVIQAYATLLKLSDA